MYSSIFVNFLIYVHICSSQIVFLFPLTAHTAKYFLTQPYALRTAIKFSLDISSIFHLSLSRQVYSIRPVASFFAFLQRIFIRHTPYPLHQSVLLLSKPVLLYVFSKLPWPHIIETIHIIHPHFSHGSFLFKHHQHSFKKDLDIQPNIPIADVLLVQAYYFLEICNVASSAYLPHSGNSRFDGESGSVM